MDEAERSATTAAQSVRDAWLNSDESPYAVHEQDGSGYVYAKNELLVLADDYKRLQSSLEARKIEGEPEHADNLGVVRFRLAPQPDTLERLTIPQLVDQLRNGIESADRKGEPLRVGPNHVVSGEPEYLGGPATAAKATTTPANVRGRLGRGVHVTVIDTGYVRGIHPYMDDHVASTGTPQLDEQPKDGHIDFEAGHSTFVAGMILHRAPQASIEVVEVLGPAGYGTEHDIAQAIVTHRGADVINLSLGGYTHGNLAPIALQAALRRVSPGTAVVAAAGNNGADRLMWPAAFKRVVAVGALERDAKTRAPFSNHGWWVDACTTGAEIYGPFPRFPDDGVAPPAFDGWAIWSGTSFAAPLVAGEIAARLSTRRFATARDAATSLVDDPTRAHYAGLGTALHLWP